MPVPDSAPSSGFAGSLRALGDGLLATVQDRVELLSIELQEEKRHAIRSVAWIVSVLFLGGLTLILGSVTLVYVFWDTARLAVLGGLTAFHFVATVAGAVYVRRLLARLPPPFEATLDEIKRDRACLREDQ